MRRHLLTKTVRTNHHVKGRSSAMNRAVISRTESALRLRAETAEDLMVPNPISLRAEAGAAEAMSLFTEKGITAAPVIDEGGRPIGVLSRGDLLIHQCEHAKHHPGEPDYFFAPTFKSGSASGETIVDVHATIADLMTPAIFAVSPDTPVQRVIADMVGLHVHRLFVVDADGVLVGVISTMDVLKRLRTDD
jgi:CBS domain-containing protein